MYELIYTNDRGQKINFINDAYRFIDTNAPSLDNQSGFRLIGFEGFGDTESDIQTQKSPYKDGSIFIDSVFDNKYPMLEFIIEAKDYKELSRLRKYANSVFNPKINGVFKITIDDEDYQLNAIPEHLPMFAIGSDDAVGKKQTTSVDFMCPNPYWQSESVTGEPAFEPRFHFPFKNKPFIMGIQRDRRIIDNDGDAPTPLQVEFFGPAENPKIINRTTGEYIKVNQTLEEDEKMMIDTTDGIKSVFFVDEEENERDVFNWIDLGSTFFDLVVGENDIEYTADSDIQGATVDITYKKYYVGV